MVGQIAVEMSGWMDGWLDGLPDGWPDGRKGEGWMIGSIVL